MTSAAISRELLTTYEGLHISAICTTVRFVADSQNHCAHFVNHVLGLDARLNCSQLTGKPGPAANVRVHETFALCLSVGKIQDHPVEPCLVFVIQRSAVNLATRQMVNLPKKHVGILCEGDVWHYDNTHDRVIRQPVAAFALHFPGDGFGVFFGTFPGETRALAVPTKNPSPGGASPAPALERGVKDNIDVANWQQFLVVRGLLSGPNIRTLVDGNFGPKTEEATEAFQVSVGVPAHARVDAATNLAAAAHGFIPRTAATRRVPVKQVTSAMTVAAVDALTRLAAVSVFYTEEALNIEGRRLIARLEPHKHLEGTQLRFWHRGITLYTVQGDDGATSPNTPTPSSAATPTPTSLPGVGHPGIDTSIYPGDAVMAHLRATTNLVWTGFYLAPAPSHPGTSWMGKRHVLLQQGWGLAPLYVGQQETGPGSHHVDAAHGTADGAHAGVLARQAEFPPGSIVYLDIETGGPLSANLQAYLRHWSARLTAEGFVAGAYLSYTSADSARQTVPNLKLWVYRIRTVDTNADRAAPFRADPPSSSGVADAIGWQWAQNCRIAKPGGKQLVDLNVAVTADPSRA
jgi:hypothetical protein